MIAYLGLDIIFYLVAIFYLFGIGVLMLIPPTDQVTAVGKSSAVRDILEGLAYVKRTSHLRWLVSLGFILVFAGVYFPLIPIYARDVLEVGPTGYVFLFGAQ